MSTYYYVACEKCREYGGFLSRQAWGWGNFDICDTFAFIANHITSCGTESLSFISEHEMFDRKRDGWTRIVAVDLDRGPYGTR